MHAATGALTILLLALAVSGCSPAGLSRQQVKDGYRKRLVEQGVADGEARCLTDAFFDRLTDAQLRAFQARDHLTTDEEAQFRDLSATCSTA